MGECYKGEYSEVLPLSLLWGNSWGKPLLFLCPHKVPFQPTGLAPSPFSSNLGSTPGDTWPYSSIPSTSSWACQGLSLISFTPSCSSPLHLCLRSDSRPQLRKILNSEQIRARWKRQSCWLPVPSYSPIQPRGGTGVGAPQLRGFLFNAISPAPFTHSFTQSCVFSGQ